MSEWNNLEDRLQSWKPRPPSPELGQRLFPSAGRANANAEVYFGLGEWFTLRWLAPAMASLVIAMLTFAQAEPQFGSLSVGADQWITGTKTPSNSSFSAHLPMRFDLDPATLDLPKLASTNASTGRPVANLGSLISFMSLVTNQFKN